jgi:hypothetical protein
MPYLHTQTEHMADVLRASRVFTDPGRHHVLAMDLMAQEAAMTVWVEGWNGIRSPRDIAHDALAEMRRRALVRSYEGRLPRVAPVLAKAA